MGKSTQTTVLKKRKLTANNSDKKPKKKLKTNEKHKNKDKALTVNEKSKETKDVNIDVLHTNEVSTAKKKTKKKETDKTESTVEKCPDKLDSQGSSDEHLPLSEILKQCKTKQNVKEKPNIKQMTKKSSLNQIGKKVEGKVELSKSESCFKISAKNAIKKDTKEVLLYAEKKSVKANIKKNVETSNKVPKLSPSRKEKCDTPLPCKSDTGDFKNAKPKGLIKHDGHSPIKTTSLKEKIMNKKHSPLKEIVHKTKSELGSTAHDTDEDGDESDMDWEDVAEVSGLLDDNAAESGMDNMPSTSSNVEVTLTVPGKKTKCGRPSQEEIRKWIQRKINRIKKEAQIAAHKVHLLTLLAIGMRKNEMCNNPLVQAVGLSLLPDIFTQRKDLKTWDVSFLSRIAIWMKNKAPNPGEIHTGNSEGTYLMRVLEKKVYFLIAILRALGLSVRLVMSLQVLSNKVEDVNKTKKPERKQSKTPGKAKQTKQTVTTPKQTATKEPKTPKESLSNKRKRQSTSAKSGGIKSSSQSLRKKAKVDYTETKSEYFSEAKTSTENISDDEEDFEIPTPKRRKSEEIRGVEPVLGESSGTAKKGRDIWIEVYLEKVRSWICIDGDISSVNQADECEKLATKPIKYVVTFDNECCIKDVTSRYASGWLTTTPKLRVDPDWLTETMSLYRSKNLKREKKEDSQLKAQLRRKPLPQTVSEYKNHPLYVLKRHLLKFEAIYPETAATLGFCRGEPVYSRDCVHTLHTRELWMKEARVVKSGELAYKIVKGRKSRRKMLENVGEIKAELFGRWQTEDYVPPPVVDGKVPRNEYGNVELFKPSMLPEGACHIQVPGIHRLARKLNIDAVPAVVGFDFHGGFNHPIMDGVVVGVEFKEQLLLAWDKEQQEKVEREKAKREKRVLDNWTHLVKSLRIRERLKRKYNVEEDDASKSKDQSPTETEEIPDISLSWPLNKQEGKTARDSDGHCHVFLPENHVQDAVTGEWSKTCACGLKEPLEMS